MQNILNKLNRGFRKSKDAILSLFDKNLRLARLDKNLSDKGERVTDIYRNDCYYTHLSIYNFALPFVKNKVVIDAGSGTGYGTHYLAENGVKSIIGLEISDKSVKYSQGNFKRDNLSYIQTNLENIEAIKNNYADVIFSSNVMEHIPDINAFMSETIRVLKSEATLVCAVPPITNDYELGMNINNHYHLHIWTPKQWYKLLTTYFKEVECYTHSYTGPGELDMSNTPEQTVINETNFGFKKVDIETLDSTGGSITAVFVAIKPIAMSAVKNLHKTLALGPQYYVDHSFSRKLSLTRYKYLDLHKEAKKLTTQFTAQSANLSALSFLIKNDPFTANQELAHRIKIFDSQGKLILDQTGKTVFYVQEMWATLSFKPLKNSEGRKYQVEISFDLESTNKTETLISIGQTLENQVLVEGYYRQYPLA